MDQKQQQAEPVVIVIGASIAGLMAASMFGERAKIIVVEKDLEPTEENFHLGRPGTLQDRHLHNTLQGGYDTMVQYFPNFAETLAKNGAHSCDRSAGVQWYHAGVWKLRYQDGGRTLLLPRPSIDKTLRECLTHKFAPGQITWMYGRRVVDLTVNADSLAINGCKLDDGTMLQGNLVIDASGRHGKVSRYLLKQGFACEPETSVHTINMTYSTQIFEYEPGTKFESDLLVFHPSPEQPHGGGCMHVDYRTVTGGKPGYEYMFATRLGYHTDGNVTSLTTEDFISGWECLPKRNLFELVSKGKPMYDKPYNYLTKEQIKHHWEDLPGMPDGFLSVGDAVCGFNPIFSQGMSHAVMGIAHLQPLIASLVWGKSCDKARRILADESFVPIILNSFEDFRFKETEGKKPFALGPIQAFAGMMYRAQAFSAEVSKTVWPVVHLQTSPFTLLDPRFLLRVVWHGSGLHAKLFG